MPGRFKDYIALPKPNMYQSLHTTVIGPGRERIEIQIRTHEMHRVAERGIAAHWKYKERHGGGIADQDAQRFGWLRQLVEWQKELKDPAEFLEGVKVDLFQDEVYVFTPKGDVRVFPRGATPVDFAFAIHSQLGEHITGARVNGKLEPLRYKLRNGDVVEVVTSREPAAVARTGSSSSGTTRARVEDPQLSSAHEQRDKSLRLGEELLERELHKAGVSLEQAPQERQRAAASLRGAQGQNLEETAHQHRLRQDRRRGRARGRRAARRRRAREQAAGAAPRGAHRGPRPQGHQARRRRASASTASTTCSSATPSAATRCRATTSSASSRAGAASPSTGAAVTKAFDTDPERRVEISWDTQGEDQPLACSSAS